MTAADDHSATPPRLSDRLWPVADAVRSGWQRLRGHMPTAQPDADAHGLRYVLADPALDARPRTLISFLGDLPETIAEMMETQADICRGSGGFPVAVVSELCPDLIAAGTMPIEFLPPRSHLALLELDDYERYVRRRWELLLAKWNFRDELEYGLSFEAFLAEQLRASGTAVGQALARDA